MANLLPTKLPQYLIRLQIAYAAKNNLLGELIAHSHYLCVEDTAYDNWNGGMYGHDIVLFAPLEKIGKIDIDDQNNVTSELKDKLNKCADAIENEFVNQVRLELYDSADEECGRAKAFSRTPPVDPDKLTFWQPGLARIFISHRDTHKIAARELGEALSEYGMSCFVAHDTIKPMTTWRYEILNGLATMEAMVLFLTDDFQDSWYCHQEVGYALGRNIPIIPLKLGKNDPPAFISEVQAARGSMDKPIEAARKLFPLIGEALGLEGRMQDVLISNFTKSPTFTDTKMRFDLMVSQVSQLTDAQAENVVSAFNSNGQLQHSVYLTSKYDRMVKFMTSTTGRRWEISDNILIEIGENASLKSAREAESEFEVGMRVFHQKFGFGAIAAVDGNKLDINFDTAGYRRVLSSFVSTS